MEGSVVKEPLHVRPAASVSDVFSDPCVPRLSRSGGCVSGGGGGRGTAGVLDSFQAAVVHSDGVSMQTAEKGQQNQDCTRTILQNVQINTN